MRAYILDVALSLLEKKSEIDIDEIAAVAGVKADVVHAYFRSWDELYRVMMEESVCARARVA